MCYLPNCENIRKRFEVCAFVFAALFGTFLFFQELIQFFWHGPASATLFHDRLDVSVLILSLWLGIFVLLRRKNRFGYLTAASLFFAAIWIFYFLCCFLFQKRDFNTGIFLFQFPHDGGRLLFYICLALILWVMYREKDNLQKRYPVFFSGSASTYGLIFLIFVLGVLHRAILFLKNYDYLNHSISDFPIAIMQYLTIPALSGHLWKSLLYLQQTPPIPNLILGLSMKTFTWPHGTMYFLIFLQSLLSLSTALLLFILVSKMTKRRWLSCIISILFVMSTDLVVMEYIFNGEGFYENLTMFLLLLTVYLYKQTLGSQKVTNAIALGVTAGFLALTRASYSYFFILPALFLLVFFLQARSKKRLALVIAYVSCIVATQFFWCAKNFVIYGTATISTSSWKGLNFAAGLSKAGKGNQFYQFLLIDGNRYPEWFMAMARNEGVGDWFNDPPPIESYLPEPIRRQDEHIQAVLQNTNKPTNSIGQRIISDIYMTAAKRFYLKHPRIAAAKFWQSYKLFWQPIRNYYGIWIMGEAPPHAMNINSFNVIETASFPLVQKANVLVLHILTPSILIYLFFCRKQERRRLLTSTYLYSIGCLLYAIAVMNLPEYGENMRFRLSVEPLIWFLSISSLMIVFELVKERHIGQNLIGAKSAGTGPGQVSANIF